LQPRFVDADRSERACAGCNAANNAERPGLVLDRRADGAGRAHASQSDIRVERDQVGRYLGDAEQRSTPVVVSCTAVCSGTIAVPVGSDTFSAKLYDAPNGGGNMLSESEVTQTIVAGAANAVNVTFNGLVASISVSVGSASAGTSSTVPVTIDALDADGKTIVGAGQYVDASGAPVTVTLADWDTSGATALSANSVTLPASGVMLSYSSLAIAPVTITATAGSMTSSGSFAPTLSAIGPATLTGGVVVNANGASTPLTFTASEPGWTNAPYNKPLTATLSTACSSLATVAPSFGTTFAVSLVTSPSNGSCTLTLSDGAGQSLVIPLGYISYAATGAMQTFAVPSGVTTLNVTAIGADGGGGGTLGGGGEGEFGTYTVTPGTSLDVLVGEAGGTSVNGAGGSCVVNSGGGAGYNATTGTGQACNSELGGTSLFLGGAGGGGVPGFADGGFGGGGSAAAAAVAAATTAERMPRRSPAPQAGRMAPS
jgi:hypothetical protein